MSSGTRSETRPTLDRWLSRRLIATLVVVQAISGLIVWLAWRYEIYDEAKKSLIAETDGLFTLVRGTNRPRPPNLEDYLDNRPESSIHLRVERNGVELHTDPAFPQRQVPYDVFGLPLFSAVDVGFGQTPKSHRRFMIYRSEHVSLPGSVYTMTGALNLREVEFRVARAFFLVAGTAIFVAGVLSLSLSLVSRQLTRRLQRITLAVRDWQPGKRFQPLPEDAATAELLDIQRVLNRMLGEVDVHHGRLSKFSTDVAHELRTSIAAAKLELELALGKERSNEEYRETLGTVAQNVETLNNTVNDLLLISRIEAKQPVLRREAVPLKLLVEELLETFEPFFDDLELRLEQSLEPVTVDLDRSRFRRVLANLLDNAIKFSEAGGEVAVRLVRRGAEGVLEIEDHGRGIPAEEIDRVFERFYRASNTLEVQGTGLGLPIVRSLIEAHGGRLEVESELGVGSLFRIVLPLSADADATTNVDSHPPTA